MGLEDDLAILYRVAEIIGTIFVHLITLSNINRFSKFFYCENQEKICNNTITKDPIPRLECVATLPYEMSLGWANCHSISLITLLVSDIAGLKASSSKVDMLNIWCKNCRMRLSL